MIDSPTLEEIQQAAERLREIVVHTPLVPLHNYDHRSDILIKPEIHQVVTSFKIRGIFNAVAALKPKERAKGLSTVSAGNTAQALAWTGRYFDVPTKSIMPESAPKTKIEAVKRYGGEPVLVSTEEVFRFLQEHLWEQEPETFIHPWTNRNVMIGHGTIGLEIMDDQSDVDSVFVPVGGGALIVGVASAIRSLNSSVRIIAVEPEGCAALTESLKQDKPATVDCKTSCDGVAIPYMTEEMFPILKDIIADVITVSEESVQQAMRTLALGNRIIVEPAAALSVAAAMATPAKKRGQTVCLVTGGSIETDQLLATLA